jgi:hypothetical protein
MPSTLSEDEIQEAERIVLRMLRGLKRAGMRDIAMYTVAALRMAGWLAPPRRSGDGYGPPYKGRKRLRDDGNVQSG